MAIHLMLLILTFGIGHCAEPVGAVENGTIGSKQVVAVGIILDLASPVGKIANSYISMALSDFYTRNANYRTRLSLSVKDSGKDAVMATSAALELMNNEEVQAIIGPQTSTETKFVINLGERAQVPIISISATSPSLSSTQSPFFIRTCQNDYSQIKALTSIIEVHGWREVVIIYEDTEYGNGLIPHLTDAFQKLDARIPYRSAISPNSDQLQILKQLNMIMARETRVLLVHMTASLGSKLFPLAKEVGMMSEGYAWMVTAGLSSLLDPYTGPKSYGSMHGVVGVRPYLPNSKLLQDFKTKWNKTSGDINLFGLWAYDTIWALAMAAESVNPNALMRHKTGINSTSTTTEPFGLRVSESGPELLKMLLHAKFEGLSGKFNLIEGQMPATDFEIINVRKKLGERIIGNWTQLHDQSLQMRRETVIWPGHTKVPPKGWVQPVVGKRLRIGVPVTSVGFKDFLKIEWDPRTDEPTFSGFSYDVFMAALDRLPLAVPHKLIPFMNSFRQNNGTYDELLNQIKLKNFDAVVGDTTITANRSTYVDFTLPYIESGILMVVKVKDAETKNIWIFLKPLRWDLWLTIGLAFVFTGFVVWFFEHRSNEEFRGPPHRQLGTMCWFSFSTLVFAHREKVESKWSRFVLVIWIFVVLIFTQSYTASLASMLTVQKLGPAVVDFNELKMNDYYVGYQKNSYVRDFLIGKLNFSEFRLRPYTSPEEYNDAMSKGSLNGGIDAIFDEIPNVKLLLAKYCSRYTVTGPTYKSAGYGFAFPIGSPLVSYISRAILNITQNHNKIQQMEHKYFAYDTNCQDSGSTFSSDSHSLSVYSFGGLFIISGISSVFACLVYLAKFYPKHWSRVTNRFDQNHNVDNLQIPSTAFSLEVEIAAVHVEDEGNHIHYTDSDQYIYGCA
ncbi:glutamate receptor 2.8-like [Ziziphus jujuba]|uniref:Glutamate receptor n=1 Tax=Ziziphus jujuba TaxID=326968 RepID=A0ABM3IIB8_ZIZJJ|nr:glutamate receptor 2.8-like [Ziziphus jujuba]